MNQTDFLEQLSRLCEIDNSNVEALRQAALLYPYCTPLRAMILCADKLWQPDAINDRRRAIETLYLENFHSIAEITANAKEYVAKPTSFDVMKEINAYQEVSFKTAPRNVLLNQFLEENNFPIDNAEPQPTNSLDEIAQKSNGLDSSLASETLAIVFAKQGKTDKAIEMYKKLIIQFPEKSSTFASRIAELENQTKK